jgi:hypothetical protein
MVMVKVLQFTQNKVCTAQYEGQVKQLIQKTCMAQVDPDIGVADVDLLRHARRVK